MRLLRKCFLRKLHKVINADKVHNEAENNHIVNSITKGFAAILFAATQTAKQNHDSANEKKESYIFYKNAAYHKRNKFKHIIPLLLSFYIMFKILRNTGKRIPITIAPPFIRRMYDSKCVSRLLISDETNSLVATPSKAEFTPSKDSLRVETAAKASSSVKPADTYSLYAFKVSIYTCLVAIFIPLFNYPNITTQARDFQHLHMLFIRKLSWLEPV